MFPKEAGVAEWDKYLYADISGLASQDIEVSANGRNGDFQIRFFRDGGSDNICAFVDFKVVGATPIEVVLSTDKQEYKFGDTMIVAATFDDSLASSSWLGIFPRSCPSVTFVQWCQLENGSGTYHFELTNTHATGPHEVRFFPTQQYQPIQKTLFYVTSDFGVELHCDSRVLDGRRIYVRWDATKTIANDTSQTISHSENWSFGVYPKDTMCHSRDLKHHVKTQSGSTSFEVSSGIQQTGDWELRMFLNDKNSPYAVRPFILVGVNEMFFEKMSRNPHKDVDIICYD